MTEITSRLSTALAGRYTIERELGAGGMATVYLAEDLKHKRKVAVKVLRPELAAVLGAERFLQEITTTANLQHPHILPLFDSGEADSFLYYVMPFIDGETLRDKLNREKQLGIDEAVKIATEVAEALDSAHRHGVIHRDIKPENILLHDGRPMVADFGIALAVSAAAGGRMTETGLSLGTPHYMSPEQATAEKELTARSDTYSLGSVLYEMLTGDPPHTGSSAQHIIMKIVTEPAAPVSKLRQSVPANVAAAVAKSLEKLAADRFESAAKFAEALANPAFALPGSSATHGMNATGGTPWNRLTTTFAVVAMVGTIFGVWSWLRSNAERASPVLRYSMAFPQGEAIDGWFTRIALSPDGSRLVYVGEGEDGVRQLWLRPRDQLHAIPLPGTDWPEAPFFSPDGERVGYFSPRGTIRVVPVGGGTPVTLTDSLVGVAGGSWGSDGYIYADAEGYGGLVRVAAGSGATEWFTTVDSARGEWEHVWPEVLPDGNGVLFVITYRDDPTKVEVAVADVATGHHEVLTPGLYARYAASGHLLTVTRSPSNLMAQPFDASRLTLSGEAVLLVEGISRFAVGAPHFVPDLTVSQTGTVMYTMPTGLQDSAELVWVSRDGSATVIDPDWTNRIIVQGLDISPDGTRLAVVHDGAIWIKELDRGPVSKMTFDGGQRPTWFPDGTGLAFISGRVGYNQAYWRNADLTGTAELLLDEGPQVMEVEFSGNREWAVFRFGGGGVSDLYARRLGADGERIPLVVTPEMEMNPALSPGGRWLAYVSLGSGRPEVWVRPFPNTSDGSWQVSTAGGTEPMWAHSGRELFYRSEGAEFMTVPIMESPTTFVYGEPEPLFSIQDYVGLIYRQMYDVSPNDQRFVMLRWIIDNEATQLVVVENLFEELRERVGN